MTCYSEALEQCLPRSKGSVTVAVLLEGRVFISDTEPMSLLDKTTWFCFSVRVLKPRPWPLASVGSPGVPVPGCSTTLPDL